jgi:ssDNA thymidine ADP-ribosyltransferase DarT-like protein
MIREGRLWCDVQRISRNLVNTNIGYSHIKERRMRHPVTVAAGGTLGNHVPFNFCQRSVMLYVVAKATRITRAGSGPSFIWFRQSRSLWPQAGPGFSPIAMPIWVTRVNSILWTDWMR